MPAPALAQDYDLSRVPASAQWAIRIDVAKFLNTDIGGFVLSETNRPENADKLTILENLTGMNIRKDIRSITLYGSRFDQRDVAAVVEGRFDQAKLLPLLRTSKPVEEIQLDSRTVYKWRESQDPNSPTKAGVFLRDDLVVVARDVEALKRSIAALGGEGDTVAVTSSDPASYLTLFLADVPTLGRNGAVATVASKIKTAKLQVGETSGEFRSDVIITSADARTALEVAQLIQGGLAALGLIQGTQRQGAPVVSPEAAAILSDIKVASDGPVATVSLRTPSKKVLDLINWAMAANRKKAAAWMQMESSEPAPEPEPAE